MKNMMKYLAILSLGLGSLGLAYDCNSDCHEEAKFRYRCPTVSNPGRKCTGVNPAKKAACEADKAVSCGLWESIYDHFAGQIKDSLKGSFNAQTYAKAVDDGEEAEYLALCQTAGVSVCVALGASYGGPWGAALSGAAGTFISYRLCHQSRAW